MTRHFKISLIKSSIRVLAGILLALCGYNFISAAGVALVGAELFGIIEEIGE